MRKKTKKELMQMLGDMLKRASRGDLSGQVGTVTGYADIDALAEAAGALIESLRATSSLSGLQDKEARSGDARYRDMVENANEMIVVIQDDKLKYCNPKTCEIAGYTSGELVRKPFLELVHPDDRDYVVDRYSRRLSGEKPPDNYRFRCISRKRGVIWVEVRVMPIEWEGRPAVLDFMTDITEQKKAEDELESSRARLQALMDAAPDAVAVVDKDGVVVAGNRPLRDMLGRDGGEVVGQRVADVLEHGTFLTRMERVTRCMVSGKSEHLTDQVGGRWYENKVAPIVESDGTIRTAAIYCRDVTKRESAGEEIRRSEEMYRTIFESTATANILVGLDTIILLANANFEKLFGYSKAELEGKMSWTSFVAKEDIERMLNYHNQRRVSPELVPSTYEYRGIARNGSIKNLYMRVAMIPGTTVSIASIIDMTERKNAQEALRASESMLSSVFRAAPIAVLVLDRERVLTTANDYATELTGYSRDEHIGRSARFLFFSEEEYLMADEALHGTPSWEGQAHMLEVRLRRKDGGETWALLGASPLDSAAPPSGLVIAAMDITGLKSLENQLRQSQKMEAIGQLAGGVAHDFNNILQTILGYSYLLMLSLDPGGEDYSNIVEVYNAGQRAGELIKQLLAFSRRQVLQLAPLDLNRTIKSLLKMLRPLIGANIELTLALRPSLPAAKADKSQIEQVIMNLCINARDAMPEGGRLAIETSDVAFDENDCAQLEWARPGKYVRLSITDSGQGMDEETRARIFEPFFSTKKPDKGTGLGLAMVYGIVRQHNGMINVYSELGSGSRFSVYLPALELSDGMSLPKAQVTNLLGTETILLAEDNQQVRHLTRTLLEKSGYKVIVASDGEEAMRAYRLHGPRIDMLLLDVVMPKKGGRSVYDEIRSCRPDVRCLFMSGYSGNAVHTDFIAEQGLQMVQKPFSNEDLLSAVRQTLDRPSPNKH